MEDGVRIFSKRARVVLRLGAVLLMGVSLTGCGLLGKLFQGSGKGKDRKSRKAQTEESGHPEGEPAKPASVRTVGEIASVHAAEGFVLIRRHSQGNFGSGTLISSLGPDGGTASLRLTGERLGRFYAADIQEGSPSKGDVVVVRELAEASKVPSTPVPQPESRAPEGFDGQIVPEGGIVKNTVISGV